jgi:hypothetical protein
LEQADDAQGVLVPGQFLFGDRGARVGGNLLA